MNNKNYQDRIMMVMREQGLTKQGLAELTGRGKATISRYLASGDTQTIPNIDDLKGIAQALDVSAHWLCFGVGERTDTVEQINQMSEVRGGRIKVYTRAEAGNLIAGGEARAINEILVDSEFANCFAVDYPVHGIVGTRWDCYAVVQAGIPWYNEDMVLARLGNNPTPDFYTLLRTTDKVIVYYQEDTQREPIHQGYEEDLDIIGVVRWGTWKRR
ncbi:helix-turn-helix domain-containing protein [Vibrio jasicida]|uniref:helix-turn-helix domain-containing protein n=1 Tax=Vibrio jasicida TaxID=766224 RepID=UPI0015E44CD8|nr:helix-turn-helix transcriptional regulator [Vibrio jasicida]